MSLREIKFNTKEGAVVALFGDFVKILSDYKSNKIAVLDKNITEILGDKVSVFNKYFSLKFDEGTKNLSHVEAIAKELLQNGVTKSDTIVAFGGGVTTDLIGFLASVFQRGTDLILVPTTLLSQVDAALGGKTGVNIDSIKNALGTFTIPKLTIIDVSFLMTQSERDFNSGMAEVIKHGVIADESYINFILEHHVKIKSRDKNTLEEMVFQSLKIKASIVEQDEFDTGIRHSLNFGHTLGHALEIEYGLLHGEAVSIGMVLESKFYESLGRFHDTKRLKEILELFSLPTDLKITSVKIFDKILNDKKRIGDDISIPILDTIGKVTVEKVPIEKILSWVKGLVV